MTDFHLRHCGECHVCCVDLRIDDKPAGEPCPELVDWGCRHYDKRPAVCRGYQCIWRVVGEDVLDDCQRPDKIGVVFTAMLASQLDYEFPGGDCLLIVARPCAGRVNVCDNWPAVETMWNLRMAGLRVHISEPGLDWRGPVIDDPLRRPTEALALRLQAALQDRKP